MSSRVLTPVGVWLQRLLTTDALKQLLLRSSSVVTSCGRLQSTTVVDQEDDLQASVVDTNRLRATTSTQRAFDDHVDRHVRSSGIHHHPASGHSLHCIPQLRGETWGFIVGVMGWNLGGAPKLPSPPQYGGLGCLPRKIFEIRRLNLLILVHLDSYQKLSTNCYRFCAYTVLFKTQSTHVLLTENSHVLEFCLG